MSTKLSVKARIAAIITAIALGGPMAVMATAASPHAAQADTWTVPAYHALADTWTRPAPADTWT